MGLRSIGGVLCFEWCEHCECFHAYACPTEEEIAVLTEELQRYWSHDERMKRRREYIIE